MIKKQIPIKGKYGMEISKQERDFLIKKMFKAIHGRDMGESIYDPIGEPQYYNTFYIACVDSIVKGLHELGHLK